MEIRADALFKATKVGGVYTQDPERFPDAELLPHVTYDRFLTDRLKVMDSTAIALCRENGLPTRVFRMAPGNIRRVLLGEETRHDRQRPRSLTVGAALAAAFLR